MKSVILGTAGHIDHGKTALVKALTGVDTDRLEEERRRGISIELGFAELRLGDARFGIVDVPGHERFVKNMLAGAGGIDLVVLVVAADEGVMPQTREHLDILDFLEVRRGIVALTKSDLVDEESREIAELDVDEALGGTCLEGARVIPVSSVTGEGIDELKRELAELAAGVDARSDSGPYRLPIDRVFTMEGFGTVVTGTGFAGSVRVGDRLELLPSGREVRVRRIQTHGQDGEVAAAGQRTALAIHGVAKEDVRRGDQLVSPGSLGIASMIDVRVRVSPRWTRPLRNRERVRFHLGSAEDLARIVLLDRDELEPGADCLAQIRLETPVVPALGDRFVLRSYSPLHAMAGGTIVDPHPTKHRRYRPDELEALERREGGGPVAILLETVGTAGLVGVKTKDLVDATSMTREDVAEALEREREIGTLRIAANGRIFAADAWRIAGNRLVHEGKRFRDRHPLRWGATREELRQAAGITASAAVLGELIDELAQAGEIEVRRDRVRVGGGDVVFEGAARAECDRIESIYREGGPSPPLLEEVLATAGDRHLAEEVVGALADIGRLERVTAELFIHEEAMRRYRESMRSLAAADGTFTVAGLRDALGISRKYAVPVLEYFDTLKETRRDGDVRRIMGG